MVALKLESSVGICVIPKKYPFGGTQCFGIPVCAYVRPPRRQSRSPALDTRLEPMALAWSRVLPSVEAIQRAQRKVPIRERKRVCGLFARPIFDLLVPKSFR